MLLLSSALTPLSSRPALHDPEASKYIAAVKATGATLTASQSWAINRLFLGLKSYGLWSKLTAFYPTTGGTANSHAINGKTPGTYNLTFNGTITHNAYGWQGDGSTGYADTGISPATVYGASNNLLSASVYINVGGIDSTGRNDLGARDNSDTKAFILSDLYSTGLANREYAVFSDGYWMNGNADTTTQEDTAGLLSASQISESEGYVFKNGSAQYHNTGAQSTTAPTSNIFIGARSNNGAVQNCSIRGYAWAHVGSSLSVQDQANLYSIVELFQTSMGRSANARMGKVGWIGDSIMTQGGGSTEPVGTAALISTALGYTRTARNQAKSGSATADWLPTNATTHYFTDAVADFVGYGVTHIYIRLGANDSRNDAGFNVSPATYGSNLKAIVDGLKPYGFKIILGYPTYCVPGSGSGIWDANSVTLLQAYQSQVSALVDNRQVFLGDTTAFSAFQADTATYLTDGVHPTAAGITFLANAAYTAIMQVFSTPTYLPTSFSNLAAWYSTGYGAQSTYSDSAVQFTATDKSYLTSVSADYNLGTSDFGFNKWIYRGGTGARVFFTKYQDANNYWAVGVDSNNKAYFKAVIGGSTLINVSGNTALSSTSTWYNLQFGISRSDAGACKIYLNGVDDTAAGATTSASTIDNTGAFIFGADGALSVFCDGRKDSFGFYKGGVPGQSLATSLYNNGVGKLISDFTSTEKVNLVSGYEFKEESGIRYDSIGTNHLSEASVNMATNGSFDSDTTGWVAGGSSTLASIAGGQSGNCLRVTNGNSSMYGYGDQTYTTVVGKLYKVSVFYKNGTTNGYVGVGTTLGGSNILQSPTLNNANWTLYTTTFRATSTTTHVWAGTSTTTNGATMLFDEISVNAMEVQSAAGIAAGLSTDGNLCSSFNGSSQYHYVASNASLQSGGTNWCTMGRAYIDSVSATSVLWGKYITTGNLREWALRLFVSGGVPNFTITGSPDGTSTGVVNVNSSVTPVPGNWYNIAAWFDGTKLNISVNNSAVANDAFGGTTSLTGAFSIGGTSDGGVYHKGRVDDVIWMKRVPTSDELTAFNNGTIPATILNDASFISRWKLNDFSAGTGLVTRNDSKGTNHLTDVGNTPSGQGYYYYEGTVSKWLDLSGNNRHLTQATQANRLLYRTNQINGKAVITGDGLSKALSVADIIGSTDVSVYVVFKPRTWGGSSEGRIIDNGKFIFAIKSSNATLTCRSDAATYATSANNSITLLTAHSAVVTRKSDGMVNFYIGGALSGSANQNSGTPSASTPITIANTGGLTRGCDGDIAELAIFNKVMPTYEIAQLNRTSHNLYNT